MTFSETFKTRWADIDANGHMRHSVYNDYGAHIRVMLFDHLGLPMQKLIQMGIGPVLFREETHFYRELGLHDEFSVDCEVGAMRKNGKIWTMIHHFTNKQGQSLAKITVDGGWLDLKKRKIIPPPKELFDIMDKLPRSEDFHWLKRKGD